MKLFLWCILFTGCNKETNGCEKWLIGYQTVGTCERRPNTEVKICDVDEITTAHAGEKVLIKHDSTCIVYKLYMRRIK
jgi:hypothetical protein